MPIALLTDFGLKDAYVGTLKAVILDINPNVAVIDIAHDIPPFDRIHAGLLLYQAFRYFPLETIFVTVVDPGVGSARKPILIETEDYRFVGPDNGVFTMVLQEQKVKRAIHLTNQEYFLKPVSATFHGRDIFSPVAAHLAGGIPPEKFGTEISDYMKLPEFIPISKQGRIVGRVLSIDRFGNAITNLTRNLLQHHFPKLDFKTTVGARHAVPLRFFDHYAAIPSRHPALIFNSAGLLEIAANQASAAELLQVKSGDEVQLAIHPRLGYAPPQ